ncbi:MAG: hypothetical protein HYV16_14880 [Gammaproteobacteria bacterium]|nr:hypothetical protein [Gammaproteobacteria bacterium]
MNMLKKMLTAGALLLGSSYAFTASALVISGGGPFASLGGAQANPAAVSTTGCASASFCTLAELSSGGVLRAGSLSFANFSLPFADGFGPNGLDAANVAVRAIDFGFAVILTYDYAPGGFGGPLPSLVMGGGGAAWDIAYQVNAGGGARITGAGIWDMGGAGFSTSDYLIQAGMAIMGAGGELGDFNAFLDILDNAAVDFGGFDLSFFEGEELLDIYNTFTHLAFEDPSLLYLFDQVFFVQQVPVPGALLLMAFGLLALRRRT